MLVSLGYSCNSKPDPEKVKWPPKIKLKAHNHFKLTIHQPYFVPKEIKYNPKMYYKQEYLSPLSIMELEQLRVQLYKHSGHDFESILRKEYYQERYGRMIRPNYGKIKFSEMDYKNEAAIIGELARKIKLNKKNQHIPVYTTRILHEIGRTDKQFLRYYIRVKDLKPIPFEDNDIPLGIRKPLLEQSIPQKTWEAIISGKKKVSDLGISKGQSATIYIVKHYYNKRLLYLISFDIVGEKFSLQDGKNFSIYDRDGILIRSIYVVGDQNIYERDYFYNSKGELNKITEAITGEGELDKVNVYVRNPLAK